MLAVVIFASHSPVTQLSVMSITAGAVSESDPDEVPKSDSKVTSRLAVVLLMHR